jgi:hypothetical protein
MAKIKKSSGANYDLGSNAKGYESKAGACVVLVRVRVHAHMMNTLIAWAVHLSPSQGLHSAPVNPRSQSAGVRNPTEPGSVTFRKIARK